MSARPGGSLPGGWNGEGVAAGAAAVEAWPRLDFSVIGAGVLAPAAVPSLRFDLRVEAPGHAIRSVSLHTQVRIAAPARAYDAREEERLYELFGAPREWGRSLRGLLWAEVATVIPAFDDRTEGRLCVPCSYDYDVAANKYLHAIRDGVIPLEFLFSGSVFYAGPAGALRTTRLSWDRECRYDMPAALWHDMMERYFPNSAWLRVRKDVFDRLAAFRAGRGLPNWEATLEALLPDRASTDPPAGVR